jgi:hypothetical protein
MKRKAIGVCTLSAKRQRVKDDAHDTVEAALTDVKSVREQAEPYRLSTAKFPLKALTPSWSIGSNRTVDMKHMQDLPLMRSPSFTERRLAWLAGVPPWLGGPGADWWASAAARRLPVKEFW